MELKLNELLINWKLFYSNVLKLDNFGSQRRRYRVLIVQAQSLLAKLLKVTRIDQYSTLPALFWYFSGTNFTVDIFFRKKNSFFINKRHWVVFIGTEVLCVVAVITFILITIPLPFSKEVPSLYNCSFCQSVYPQWQECPSSVLRTQFLSLC